VCEASFSTAMPGTWAFRRVKGVPARFNIFWHNISQLEDLLCACHHQ
jgi:hypothetical protein